MALAHVKSLPWPTAMPDDEWEEVKQGVPAKDEPFINKYISGREALIEQEQKQRSGIHIPTPNYRNHTYVQQTMHSNNRSPL
jgi:hypothetical protein